VYICQASAVVLVGVVFLSSSLLSLVLGQAQVVMRGFSATRLCSFSSLTFPSQHTVLEQHSSDGAATARSGQAVLKDGKGETRLRELCKSSCGLVVSLRISLPRLSGTCSSAFPSVATHQLTETASKLSGSS
jgi:hypothetical protein